MICFKCQSENFSESINKTLMDHCNTCGCDWPATVECVCPKCQSTNCHAGCYVDVLVDHCNACGYDQPRTDKVLETAILTTTVLDAIDVI